MRNIWKFLLVALFMVAPAFVLTANNDEEDSRYNYIFDAEITVTDAVSDVPLQGVTVRLLTMQMEKTSVRVKTDEAGKIKLENLVVNYYLSFSKFFYRTKVVKLDENKPVIEVTLNPKK